MKALILFFLANVYLINLSIGQAEQNRLFFLGYQNDTPIFEEQKSRHLYRLDSLSKPIWVGGKMVNPYFLKNDLLIVTYKISKAFAWEIYRDFEEVRMQIFNEIVVYPAYDGGNNLYFMVTPPNDSAESVLQVQNLETGATEEISHIAGAFPYNLTNNDLIYARFMKGGKYPWVEVVKENILDSSIPEVILLSDVHLSWVFPSQTGRYIAYYDADKRIFLLEVSTMTQYALEFPEFKETTYQFLFDEEQGKVILFNPTTHQLTPFHIADLPLVE